MTTSKISWEEYHALTEPYFHSIGYIASGWGHLEHAIDHTIWKLAGVEDDAGACLTAQFLGTGNRLAALEALLRLRCIPLVFIKATISPFKIRIAALAKRRNRAVHDPLQINEEDSTTHVHRIIAESKLDKTIKPADIEWYNSVMDSIFVAVRDWFEIEKAIFELLRTYEQKSLSEP